MAKGNCNLCNKEKELIKKSHIISDFLHSELYDENHKLRAFDPKDLKKVKPRISKPSSGSYEGNILCKKCDNEVIGRYETYISNLLKDNLKDEEKVKCKLNINDHGLSFTDVSNLDYDKTKLFLLSLLFRAHISTRKEYIEVDLGPYEDDIRKQILAEKASKEDDIEVIIFKLPKESGFANFIGQPRKHEFENTTTYSIIINGYMILYYLKPNSLSKQMYKQRLSEKGTVNIMEIPIDKVTEFVLAYTGALE